MRRVVRDISAAEVKFVLGNFSYNHVEIGGKYERTLLIPEGTTEAIVANGLSAVGVLVRTEQLMKSANRLAFSPLRKINRSIEDYLTTSCSGWAAPAAEGHR